MKKIDHYRVILIGMILALLGASLFNVRQVRAVDPTATLTLTPTATYSFITNTPTDVPPPSSTPRPTETATATPELVNSPQPSDTAIATVQSTENETTAENATQKKPLSPFILILLGVIGGIFIGTILLLILIFSKKRGA